MQRLLLPCLALLPLVSCKALSGNTPDEKRDEIDRVTSQILDRLYVESPSAKGQIENAVGYGVFTNYSTKVFFLSAGNGYGQVTANESGDRTYMRVAEVGAGLGLGVRDFSVVFVFETDEALERFVDVGWNVGGSADAAATYEGDGAELSGGAIVAPGVLAYQMTDNGLALSATISGTRYWVDAELN